jgi:two-component system sensor histidine kinase/response regulator
VRAQLAAGERGAAARTLHRLRGVAANLGALEVARLALGLEGAAAVENEAALAQRLAILEAAMDTVLHAARALPAPPDDSAPGTGPADPCKLHEELAQLLDLLQNNNMKAMTQFETLRPALAGNDALAEAIATLRFDTAATMVRDIIRTTKENA